MYSLPSESTREEEKSKMQNTMEMRLAVLIDADNVPHDRITGMMKEIARYGTPTIKRIYGDWTKPDLKGWKNILLSHAITPVQQYRYTVGKNATDSAMIIDAMDMLYAGNLDGFCIVSSDSDFTRLAIRLRESGKRVFGMGERKTPKPFIVACDKFTYIEIIDMAVENVEDEPEPVRRISGARTAGSPHAQAGRTAGSVRHEAPAPVPASTAASVMPAVGASIQPAASAAALPAGKAEPGKGNGDRFGGSHPEIRHGSTRPETVVPFEVKPAAEKAAEGKTEAAAANGKTEAAAANGTRPAPGKGRSRRRNVAQRVEDRSEAVMTVQVQGAVPVVEDTAAAGNMEDSGKPKHAEDAAPAASAAASAERGTEALNPIVETVNREIIELIGTSITDLADENGWAFLGDVGTLIAKKKPDFDPRNYGFVKLTPLIRSLDMFELDIRETSQFHIKHVYVRNRKRPNE
jgi:hypothetical protein